MKDPNFNLDIEPTPEEFRQSGIIAALKADM